MNEQEARKIAALVRGTAINSGGNVWIVEIRNNGLVLCLGFGGWKVEDGDGETVAESDFGGAVWVSPDQVC